MLSSCRYLGPNWHNSAHGWCYCRWWLWWSLQGYCWWAITNLVFQFTAVFAAANFVSNYLRKPIELRHCSRRALAVSGCSSISISIPVGVTGRSQHTYTLCVSLALSADSHAAVVVTGNFVKRS